jgi:BlaI family transcriptional regulator, penicillinase repressor
MVDISDAESRIMEILWRDGPTGGEEIVREVSTAQGCAEGTVRTLIMRLKRKKAIRSRKDGVRAIYHPQMEREDYVASQSQNLIDRLFGGKITPLMVHFAEKQKLSAKDMEALKKLMEKLDR